MIVLRLDRKALAEFIESQPEEFKFELSRAVLAEASRNLVRGIVPADVLKILQAGVDAEVAVQIGSVTGGWGKGEVKLNPEVKKEIENLVKEEAGKLALEAYKKFRKELDSSVEYYLSHAKKLMDDKFKTVAWGKIRDEINEEVERKIALAMSN